jgi:bleomycin hydrolase
VTVKTFDSIEKMLKNQAVCTSVRSVAPNNPFDFNVVVTPELPAAYQAKTGRCWMFAGMTMLRYLAKHADEFSYAHLFYHDKCERYLQTLLTLVDLPYTLHEFPETVQRFTSVILRESMSDGGQWDLFAALVKRHGLMPRSAMSETFHTTNSKSMVALANHMLRVHYGRLVSVESRDERVALAHELAREASDVYAQLLGVPPGAVEIGDEVVDPKGVPASLGINVDDFVSVVHDPRRNETDAPRWYELSCLFTAEGKRVGWLAVSLERMEALALAMLQAGMAVWFGANITELDTELSLHDPALCDYAAAWPSLTLTKRAALETFHRVPSHAMVMTGAHVHKKMKVPVRWRVDNSWGSNGTNKGKHVMTARAFRECVFQIVVHKKLLVAAEASALARKGDAIQLPPDDPLATLAR